jgi:hypothetical protein
VLATALGHGTTPWRAARLRERKAQACPFAAASGRELDGRFRISKTASVRSIRGSYRAGPGGSPDPHIPSPHPSVIRPARWWGEFHDRPSWSLVLRPHGSLAALGHGNGRCRAAGSGGANHPCSRTEPLPMLPAAQTGEMGDRYREMGEVFGGSRILRTWEACRESGTVQGDGEWRWRRPWVERGCGRRLVHCWVGRGRSRR